LIVDPTNVSQATAWGGRDGVLWAARAAHFDRAVAAHHRGLMAAAAVSPHDRILDVGCGTGQATRDAARAASRGHALGVDLSAQMLRVARRLTDQEQLANVSFVHGDAQVHPFTHRSFDLALSRMGTMFFGDPAAGFANIATALRSGGRLAIVVWQHPAANEWITAFRHALAGGRELPAPSTEEPGAFAQAEPARVEALLTSAGFCDVTFTDLRPPMWFGQTPDEALDFVRDLMGGLVAALEDRARHRALDALHDVLTSQTTADGVVLGSAVWVVEARRR
jgi:SAM-dependent methyltransferase